VTFALKFSIKRFDEVTTPLLDCGLVCLVNFCAVPLMRLVHRILLKQSLSLFLSVGLISWL